MKKSSNGKKVSTGTKAGSADGDENLLQVKTRRSKRSQLTTQPSHISAAVANYFSGQQSSTERGQKLIINFRGSIFPAIQAAAVQHLKEEYLCEDAVVLRIFNSEKFNVYGLNEAVQKATFLTKSYLGVSETVQARSPQLIEHCEPWKQIFVTFMPNSVLLVPDVSKSKVDTITVLGYSDKVPPNLTQVNAWKKLIGTCRLLIPLIVNSDRYDNDFKIFTQVSRTMDGVKNVAKEIQQIDSCINSIGIESQSMFSTVHCVVFVVLDDAFEPQLMKYYTIGGSKVDDKCPNRDSHNIDILPQVPTFPAGWAALNKKPLLINNQADLEKFCGVKGLIHTVGGCIGKNVMCFVVEDYSADMPLLVELTDRVEGFSEDNRKETVLFSKLLSPILSSTVMLDYRRKAIRRCDITNELLNNIKTVQFTKVQHILDLKFKYSSTFQRKFFSSKFAFRSLTPSQYPGVIIYMFTELGLISRWKIRRATLIRFILSMQQGYRDNPYHNWKHACTVAHFAFILLKKLDLVKGGFLQEIEALALIVASLSHDIDHRGVNNHFSLCADTDPYHIYLQEDGLMERHHVAVTMQVLASDDCNIVENLNDEEYRLFMELLQWTILATDIGKYLQTRAGLFAQLKNFDKKNSEHRKCLLSSLMTACDLCETLKPWNDYTPSVKSIFAEFFTQGDEELRLGFIPTPMMDRRIAYIPYIEMKFINEIVRPVYNAIAELIPKTDEFLHTIDYYKELWLVATKVFDDNSHLRNPLEILDLPELREERLKTVSNPNLEQKAGSIRMSLITLGSFNGGTDPIKPKTKSKGSVNMMSMNPTEVEDERPASCKDIFFNFFCCLRCRRKALFDAGLVRRTHLENEFMEERSELYEERRSSLDQSIERKSNTSRKGASLNNINNSSQFP